ncbi:MAG: A/G-specific adenine glycosylase [Oscillatoriales cyanobacterium SM2_2_1]|nr:A/G-specific adenine glycosylase [Oscillatoriales cyanobacterium SM2_2_1]
MTLANALLAWYAADGRSLPWRQHRDPYRIWISEIMLQQTQVVSVIPYYGRWMARFPDLKTLAIADIQEVLHLWQGLGYYQRAQNLHRTAQILWHTHHGEFPREVPELRQLPGIGAYTAGAIAAIAYNQPQPAIDGNVRRILCRLFAVHTLSGTGDRQLEDYYRQIMPAGRNRDFLQALMDLGALICTAKVPQCSRCPIASHCGAHHQGIADQIPHKPRRSPIPTRTAIALVHRTATHTLMQQSSDRGL